MTVLIVSAEGDVHADAVREALTARSVPVVQMDIGEFPAEASIAAHIESDGRVYGYLERQGRPFVHLSQVSCGWYRRPTSFRFGDGVRDRHWAGREARQGVGGVLACLPWLNDPTEIARAEYKPYQLHLAGRCGLRVPASVVTNVLSAARMLADEHGPLVRKRLSGAPCDGDTLATAAVRPALLSNGEAWPAVQQTAHLFQQRLCREYDLRVTVVDDRLFGVRIDSPHLDWRIDPHGVTYQSCTVDTQVADGIRVLLDRLRLRYAALDFVVDAHGRSWFLEVNPNGQWLWLDELLGLGIADAIADALAGNPCGDE